MPDELPRPVPRHLKGKGDADLLDQAHEFRAAFGAWPRTWVEFSHGMAHLARASTREKLRMADAVAAHKQKRRQWNQWVRDHQALGT